MLATLGLLPSSPGPLAPQDVAGLEGQGSDHRWVPFLYLELQGPRHQAWGWWYRRFPSHLPPNVGTAGSLSHTQGDPPAPGPNIRPYRNPPPRSQGE